MKIKDILNMLRDGKKPVVVLTDNLWDESWGEKGMIARITSFSDENDGTVKLYFDYNENKEHNLALQGHDWWIGKNGEKGTAFEAGMMKEDDIQEDIYLMPDDDAPFKLSDENKIMNEYLKSKSKLSYVEWLENFIEQNVPNCMKPWESL